MVRPVDDDSRRYRGLCRRVALQLLQDDGAWGREARVVGLLAILLELPPTPDVGPGHPDHEGNLRSPD